MYTCCHCASNKPINQEYQQAFGVCICNECKRYEPTISKSNAKSMYLLSDADLNKLGFIEKQNPQHKEWATMKKYLVSQVEASAVRKYGSLDEIQERKQRKVRVKIEDRAKRRLHEEQKEEEERKLLQSVKATVDKYSSIPASQQQPETEEVVDPDTGKRQKRFAPEYAAAEVEEF